MKILLNGDITPSINSLDDLGIKYENTEEGVIVTLDNKPKIAKPGENWKEYKGSSVISNHYPLLYDYIVSDDRSLEQFVFQGSRIIASGDIVPSDSKKYDYICEGQLRVYSNLAFFGYEYILAGEVESEPLYEYVEKMLESSSKSKGLK